MSLGVLAGFAGVLVAAAATGMLAGRCVRQPRAGVILCAVATLALTVALAAQSLGFARGFGPATFRAVQLCALLLAPLALAWGLIELVARSGAVRFGTRLVSSALIVVAAVILATDPLNAEPFGKSWPSAGLYSQPPSLYALDGAAAAAVVAVAVSVILVLVYARKDARWRAMLTAVGPVGLAVLLTVALRLSLPDGFAYPLLGLIAAGLVWFGMTRAREVPGGPAAGGPQGGEGLVSDAPAERYAAYRTPAATFDPRDPARTVPAGLGVLASPGPETTTRAEQASGPQATAGRPGPARAGRPGPAASAAAAASAATPAARPYGRILIFTVLEDRVTAFDRLAEQVAEEVMAAEPDTLVYVIHLVPNAPLQRIFYEVYRDRAAFEWHENQPYMKRFVAARRSCVLATNVIELRLKYAKVAPLPAPAGPRGPAVSGGTRAPLGPEQQPRPARRLDPLPPSSGRRYGGD